MKKYIKIICTILMVTLLTGCWDQKIYEKIGFILNAGIDKGSDDNTLFTISIPIIGSTGGTSGSGDSSNQSGDSKAKDINIYTAEANLIREEREILRFLSPKNLEGGKIQNVLFGSDFAKEKGISEYLELYERDTQSTTQSWVVIVDGTANELITKGVNLKGTPRLGEYINELLDRNSKSGYCPKMTIIKYSIENVIPGLSPIIPMIKLEPNNIKVTGTALISQDKMTGQIDTHETACLFMAMGKTKRSEISFELPEDIKTVKKKAIVFIRKVNTKSKLSFNNGIPVVDFNLKIDAVLDEYTWGQITKQDYELKIEGSLSNHIKSCLDNVFKKLQDAKCDALGIGDKLRAYHYNYWESIGELDGWKKIYPNIAVKFDVNTDIIRYGEIQ